MPFQVKFSAGFGSNTAVFETAKDALAAVHEAQEDKRDSIEVFELSGAKMTVEELVAVASGE